MRTIILFFVLATLNLQAQWITLPSGTLNEFDGVLVEDASNYWIGGENGMLLRTLDGGSTWTTHTISGGGDLGTILRLNATTLLIAADDGLVARTTDNGGTWALVSTGAPNVLYDLTRHGDLVWASGRDGGLVHSTDQGQTWIVQTSGTNQRIHGIHALNATDVIAVGRNGVLLRTSDGGNNWQLEIIAGGEDLRAITFLNDALQTGLIAGPPGEILRSTDLGTTWTAVTFPSNLEAQAFGSEDASVVYAVGDNALIQRSTDQGASWETMSTTAFSELSAVGAAGGVAVAVGANGTIIKLGGDVGIKGPACAGGLKIYPNPGADRVIVEWEALDEAGNDRTLDLLTTDGRLVESRVWSPGVQHAHFEGLSPGTYLVRMTLRHGGAFHKTLVIVGG